VLEVAVRKQLGAFSLRAAFNLPTPGVIALFGRSGSGKSMLVNIIAGLLPADDGDIRLDGAVLTASAQGLCVPPEERRMGYVFQDARLFPHLTVGGNLRYGERRARGVARVVAFDEVVSLLGLQALLQRRPRQLSGGERQRVALGRALLSQPRLLLLDEPLAALDVARREEVLPYLEKLRDRLAIPMVYVSHQFEEVLRMATHVVLLQDGQVLAQGSVDEMSLEPQLQRIVGPELVGAVVEGTVTQVDARSGTATVALGSGVLQVALAEQAPGSRVRLQLLARDVILALQPVDGLSVRNALPGSVHALRDDGFGALLVSIDVGGATVLSRITLEACQALSLAPGKRVWALFKAVATRGHAYRISSAARA
jgi:molybdate transport system ATP-binding protein